MLVRWDAILLAAAVAGGSVLIENSHRLDTGAPDEEVVGASTCATAVSARVWKPADDGATDADSVQLPLGCTPE
ncbi:MAG TPA: hypothetical protein VLX44_10780 [Xanthobacteraceae bacterium]|nr:hypothetical protein [Xanthobacteraceae bacterium]